MRVIKKLSITFLFVIVGICSVMVSNVSSVKSAGGIKIDKAHFSDSMIYYCEKDFDTNHDGYLSQSEISKAKIIYDLMYDTKRYVYRDFRGIEYLTSLEKIELEHIRIVNFNVYKLPKLKSIKCTNCKFKKTGIKCDKLKSIEELIFFDTDIKYKGDFRYNKKLKSLSVYRANVNKVAVKKLKNLKSFEYFGDMKKINLSKNVKLEHLDINMSRADKIDISHNKKLKELRVGGSIKSFDLKNNKLLKDVDISSDVCTSIDINGFGKLKYLKLEMPLADIRVTNNISLRSLRIKTNLKSIDLTGNEKVTYCEIDAPLETFDASIFGNLGNLILSNLRMDELKLINGTVKHLELHGCDISTVDISLLDKIKRVHITKGNTKKLKISENNLNISGIHAFKCNGLAEIEIGSCSRFKRISYGYSDNEDEDTIVPVEEWLDVSRKTIMVPSDVISLWVTQMYSVD